MNILTSLSTHAPDDIVETTLPERIGVLLGVLIPFLALISGIILLWHRGIGWLELNLLIGMYAATVIGICVGYHRLLTHRAFSTYPAIRLILIALGSMSLQGPVLQWCGVHRRHHQQSDREGDPHSPHQHGRGFWGFLLGMWHSHLGWLFESTPPDLNRSISDLLDDKAVVAGDRWFWVFVVLGLAIPTAIAGAIGHTWHAALLGFLWGGLIRMCLMHHATFSINSVCHLWGTRPFQSPDHSRNNPVFGVISFGEGWHNNHHAFPTSARHGLKWWQLDISWIFIRALQICHLAWDVRLPSPTAMQAKLRIQSAA